MDNEEEIQEIKLSKQISLKRAGKKGSALFFRSTRYRKIDMIAYEFYFLDGTGKEHLIGILPERRKNPERITKETALNWARKVIGDQSDVNDIYFVPVEI